MSVISQSLIKCGCEDHVSVADTRNFNNDANINASGDGDSVFVNLGTHI
jgi:hypothetical protein